MKTLTSHTPQIAFMLGKPLKSRSVLAEVVERLHHRCPSIMLYRSEAGVQPPPWLRQSDLVVHRGLSADDLVSVAKLERAGVRTCNRSDATPSSMNRAHVIRTLASSGFPVPGTTEHRTWPELVSAANRQPVVVKAVDGEVGRAAQVFIAPDGELPDTPAFEGPYIVQEYIPDNALVHKVYVAGERLKCLLKRSPPTDGINVAGIPYEIDEELRLIAMQIGTALGLEIYGVDVLYDSQRPYVIDVNPFPGFRGVPGGGRIIARHIEQLIARSA